MKVLKSDVSVTWADCDAAGKVFYPNFYVWFDKATEVLFKANGAWFADIAEAYGVVGMPLLETGANYQNPCEHGNALEMESWVDEWNGRHFVVRHKLTHVDGRPALEGFERRCWVVEAPEKKSGIKAFAVPDDVIARFEQDE